MSDVTSEAQAIVLRTIYGPIMDKATHVSVPGLIAYGDCVRAVAQALATAEVDAVELRVEVERKDAALRRIEATARAHYQLGRDKGAVEWRNGCQLVASEARAALTGRTPHE